MCFRNQFLTQCGIFLLVGKVKEVTGYYFLVFYKHL